MGIFNFTSPCFPPQILQPFREKGDGLFFKKGQLIYQEGSTPLGAYFVEKGKVKISKTGSLGKEKIVKIAIHPELLSFSDLFSRRKYTTSAETLEETFLLFVSKEDFWKVLNKNQEIFSHLLCRLAEDINRIEETVTDLAYKPVRGRLADAILSLDDSFNGTDGSSHSICLTRTDLAGYVGTVKETVNRLLSELKEEKIISTLGSRIEIHDREKLNKISKLYN
ncbi:Crp/Fnr family transcriptional regulator [Salinimicrobium sp. TH3]|uniref:Crp/Fnr family transcriptional regulator n=1 Tax=Salinimicrobium sp. TH3 TaxID=2997342 RepID=UPI002275A761|nr:Crp/Fnr family transcriptional regulator [Salinimicrobium sp. TH3]MCY2686999.1 Crp/Fnr family transcriptional regulator [Salinimicrobium sp. TH3]